jgi:hypothetical protein
VDKRFQRPPGPYHHLDADDEEAHLAYERPHFLPAHNADGAIAAVAQAIAVAGLAAALALYSNLMGHGAYPLVATHGDVVVEFAAQLACRLKQLDADLAELGGTADLRTALVVGIVAAFAARLCAFERRAHTACHQYQQFVHVAAEPGRAIFRFAPGGVCVFHAPILRAFSACRIRNAREFA